MQLPPPSPRLFNALLSGNVPELLSAPPDELRPFLPSLSRMVLVPSAPAAVGGAPPGWEGQQGVREKRKKAIHTVLAGITEVNAIRSYLRLNFQELRQDALKEQQLLRKLNPEDRGQSQSVLASSLQFGLAIEFERSNFLRRFRLFLSEILKVLSQLDSPGHFKLIQSDLFECDVHLEEICDIMCLATAELPSLLPVVQLSEALLWLHNGPHLLARVIANMPVCFDQVVTSLVLNGETLDEVSLAGRCRTNAIRMLCHMHPARSAYVQHLAVSHCKHPTLALSLALEQESNGMRLHRLGMESERNSGPVLDPEWSPGQAGVITLLHNIIIAGDDQTRAWFAQYLKCMQQKYRRHKHSAVTKLRSYLLKKLHSFNTPSSPILTPSTFAPPPIPETKATELMETESSVIIEEMNTASVILSEKTDTVSIEELSSMPPSSSSETLEELVDQMEIEISDHEGEEGSSAEETGEGSTEEELEEVVMSGEVGKEGEQGASEEVVISEKIESSTRITTTSGGGHGGSVGGAEVIEGVVSRSGGRVREGSGSGPSGRRRKYSSHSFEKIEFPVISTERQLSNEDIMELMGVLQVCCALKTQTQMYLKEEEAAAILSLIVCTCPPFSPAGVHFIEVTLCVMLACPFLISIDGCEGAVVRWFQWLLEKLPDFDKACGGHCSYGELLLLISIHLREKQFEQIEELIVNTLKMKVSSSLRSGHFTALSRLFLRVFTEEVVCTHAVSVPPTHHLSAEVKGYLPVHCIHQLIKMRNFRKYNISIKDWIYEQLLVVSEPLHPTLPPLLQEFVNSVLVSSITTPPRNTTYMTAATSKNHTPFSAEEVLSVFRKDPDTNQSKYSIPSQLLMIYYVLLYQDCFLTNLKALLMQDNSGGRRDCPRAYSRKVLTQIPMKYLLDHARRFQSKYSTLYPTLLKLTAMQFPQLCLVCEWMTERRGISALENPQHCIKLSIKKISPESALRKLQQVHTNPSKAVLLLNNLSSLPPNALVPYAHCVTATLPLLLHSPSVSRQAQDLYVMLWTKLNTVIPCKMWLDTVNALRPPEMQQMQGYSHEEVLQDPLILLRCDTRAFRCPPIMDLILRCLASYTSTAKTWLHEQAHVQSCVATARPDSSTIHMTKQERDEACIALSATQESAVIQLMLEVCLPTEEDKKFQSSFGAQLSPLREVRCLICSYLHHTFIEEPSLAKLVHFQGYPPELIPMMVSGIPSMHICLDFIPELLAQPRMERQVFGVQLAAHVIHQYPVPDTMGIAKDILKRLTVLSGEIPNDIREAYFLSLLPSLTLLCKSFPPLSSEVTEFLVHLTKLCQPAAPSSFGVGGALTPAAWDWANGGGEGDPLIRAIKRTFNEIIVSITA